MAYISSIECDMCHNYTEPAYETTSASRARARNDLSWRFLPDAHLCPDCVDKYYEIKRAKKIEAERNAEKTAWPRIKAMLEMNDAGKTQKEIAEIFGLSYTRVNQLISRGRRLEARQSQQK